MGQASFSTKDPKGRKADAPVYCISRDALPGWCADGVYSEVNGSGGLVLLY